MVGREPDPWQTLVLERGLGEHPGGQFVAREVGINVARQNGKGDVLLGRQLYGLFVLHEELIIHSAHLWPTAKQAFQRLVNAIDSSRELSRHVRRWSRSHGEQGLETKWGSMIEFRTRTKGGARGMTADCVILDEAMFLPDADFGALLPTLSARPNPQVWYAGSAVDQEIHDNGLVFARVRDRALSGDDDELAYLEWSAEGELADAGGLARDQGAWGQANPAFGIRITPQAIEMERRAMAPRTFAVERLGIGDWPDLDVDTGGLSLEAWQALVDPESQPGDPVCFAFDVTPRRTHSAICVAGKRDDGLVHVEVVEHRPGTKWVVSRLVELLRDHNAFSKVVVDGASPAASLLAEAETADLDVETLNVRECAQAAGLFFDAVEPEEDQAPTLRHLGQQELAAAVRGAVKGQVGDAWKWSRRQSVADISPLVGCTLALWGLEAQTRESVYASRGALVV